MQARISSNIRVITACAAVGLACMFGGIWLSDAQLVTAESVPGNIITMRVCTLVIYLLLFWLSFEFSKRPTADIRLLFGSVSVFGLASFAVGAVLLFCAVPALEPDGAARAAVAVLAVFLVKVIGAPVSVGLVCVFARLDHVTVMRACAAGMLGAFVLYSLFSQNAMLASFGKVGIVIVSAELLVVSMLCGWVGLGGVPAFSRKRATVVAPVRSSFALPGVVKRPWRKIITPGLVLELAFSAMMLGFLRNGITGSDPHSDPVSFAALVAILLIAVFWRGLNTEHVFYAGLICAAVGVLLEAQLDYVFPGASDFLFGLGVAFFEVVMWTLVVWVARNADVTLMAAAGARLVATAGHLMGTLLVAFAVVITPAGSDALRSGELMMVLLYFLFMMALLKFPALRAPFAAPYDAIDYDTGTAYEVAQEAMLAQQEEEAVRADGEGAAAGSNGIASDKEPAAAANEPLHVPFMVVPEQSPQELSAQTFEGYIDTIAETYKLTAREREVLELIAHGRNMPYMEEALYISRNTLKMHIRHIYTKLDVHSKQEIIDMVESLALQSS